MLGHAVISQGILKQVLCCALRIALVLAVALLIPPDRQVAQAQETDTSAKESAQAQAPATEPSKNRKAKPGKKKKAQGKASKHDQYTRIKTNAQGVNQALQTAIVRFVGNAESKYAGFTVDLVGVVHIGEKAYYDKLDKRLSKYDTVLYELVAPDGTRIRPKDLQTRRSVLASVQTGMKDMLELEYQLEQIDYMAKNFRHADMSPTEFANDLKRRGDSLGKMLGRMLGASIAAQSRTGGDLGILLAMTSNDRPHAMKNAMAKQLLDMEAMTAGMSDENGEDTLIKGRNRKAFEILSEELAAGKKNVAVFYGAGHLADMADRLKKDFQMQPTKTIWLDAWDLNPED